MVSLFVTLLFIFLICQCIFQSSSISLAMVLYIGQDCLEKPNMNLQILTVQSILGMVLKERSSRWSQNLQNRIHNFLKDSWFFFLYFLCLLGANIYKLKQNLAVILIDLINFFLIYFQR